MQLATQAPSVVQFSHSPRSVVACLPFQCCEWVPCRRDACLMHLPAPPMVRTTNSFRSMATCSTDEARTPRCLSLSPDFNSFPQPHPCGLSFHPPLFPVTIARVHCRRNHKVCVMLVQGNLDGACNPCSPSPQPHLWYFTPRSINRMPRWQYKSMHKSLALCRSIPCGPPTLGPSRVPVANMDK